MDLQKIHDALSQLADEMITEEECKEIILLALGIEPSHLTELHKMQEIAALWD